MPWWRLPAWLPALLLCCGLLASPLAGAQASGQPTVLQLHWRHQFEFAGFYAALEQGYYRQAGIELSIREYQPELDLVDEVLSQRASFGIWGSQLISERLRGRPIVLLANYFKRSPLVILSDAEIRLPSDLRGRRLMVPASDIGTISYQIMFREFGLSQADLTLVPHSFSVDEFVRGEVDAMSAFLTDQPYAVRQAGKAFNVLDPNNYGAELYDVNLFTSAELAAAEPARVRAFLAASNRGWAYALEHPQELVELILERYNSQQRSREQLLFEARETAKVMLPKVYPPGSIDPQRLRRMAELYVQIGEADSVAPLQGFVFDAEQQPVSAGSSLQLSAEERAWLARHPRLRVSNELDWPPFDYFENGAPKGYSVGLVKLLAEKLGVDLEFVQGDSWEQLVERFCAGEIDLLQPTDRPARVRECGLFSSPIIRETTQFLTRKGGRTVHAIDDLFGGTVASPRGWEQTELLRELYGDRLQLLETSGIREAIEAVRDGRADFTLDFGSVLRHHVHQLGYTNLQVQGIWDKAGKGGEFDALYLATPRQQPLLQGLIEKALGQISAAEKEHLQTLWLSGGDTQEVLEFTAAEREFLSRHRRLRVSNEANFPPYDFTVDGKPSGYSIELIERLAQRIGVEIEFVSRDNWHQLVELHRRGELDLLHSLNSTPERQQYGLFSQPYTRIPSVFITRKDHPEIASFAELEGKTVAVGRGWSLEEYLRQRHPGVRRLQVDRFEQMLDAVVSGAADVTIEGEPALRYWVRRKGLHGLKIAGVASELDARRFGTHHFMAQKQAPELVSILDKALASLSPAEMWELQGRWLYPPMEGREAGGSQLQLSAEERAYLQAKGKIRMCVAPDAMPYERINAEGAYEGIGADIMHLVGERIGANFELVPTASWSESLAAIRSRRCDMLPLASDVPSRRDAMEFTANVLLEPLVVVTRHNELFVPDAAAIGQRPIGIVRGYSYIEDLRAVFPQMQIVEVDNLADGLAKLRGGAVWGYVDASNYVAYALATGGAVDLKIAGRLEFNNAAGVATRNDEPLLGAIMRRAVASISDAERRAIINRWVAVRFEQGFDYALFWKLALGVVVLLLALYAWNRRLARFNLAIERARGATQAALDQVATLLDNSGQGFLACGADLAVAPGCSRECERIFGRSPVAAALPDLLAGGQPERRALLAKTLPLALDRRLDPLRRAALLDLLPAEFELGEHSYQAQYRPLQDGRMMLVLTDISAERRLRERLAQERLRLEFIVHALENRDDLLELLHDFDRFRRQQLPAWLSFEADPARLLIELARALHTFKGRFAQANLPTLPRHLHRLEDGLAALQRGRVPDLAAIKQVLGGDDLGAALDADLALLREKLGAAYFNSERAIRVAESTLDALEREARELYGRQSRMLALVHQLRYVELHDLLAPACRAAEQLAARQGKPLAPVHCSGPSPRVDPDRYGGFCKALVHVFRNAVDHGIEDSDERWLADKPERASIRCQIELQADRLQLTVEDDGRGIDLERLREQARRRGALLPEAELEPATLTALLLADGFSTREQVDEVSGRGIGLAAVRVELERLGGELVVSSWRGRGCRFCFSLPYQPALAAVGVEPAVQHAESLLQPLPQLLQNMFSEHLQLALEIDPQPREVSGDGLYEFAAVIALDLGFAAELGLSLQRPLLLELARRFEPDFAEAEVLALADSVGAELLNTLAGNATVFYTHLAHHVAMGTPRLLPPEDREQRCGRRLLRALAGQTPAGALLIFCLLPEDAN